MKPRGFAVHRANSIAFDSAGVEVAGPGGLSIWSALNTADLIVRGPAMRLGLGVVVGCLPEVHSSVKFNLGGMMAAELARSPPR